MRYIKNGTYLPPNGGNWILELIIYLPYLFGCGFWIGFLQAVETAGGAVFLPILIKFLIQQQMQR